MALVEFGLFLMFTAAPFHALSKNLPESTSTRLENALKSPQDDSTIPKRSLHRRDSDINLSFGHGMRDFIINGQGLSLHTKTRPAFQATLTSGNIGPNYALGAIKFNDVSLNIGGTYSPSTGKFTAPVDGLYLMSVSYLQQNGYTSHVRLMKDNTVYSDLHANHKNFDQLSKTVLAVLKKGETFWVKLEKNSVYAVHGSSRYTTFGGFLLSYGG